VSDAEKSEDPLEGKGKNLVLEKVGFLQEELTDFGIKKLKAGQKLRIYFQGKKELRSFKGSPHNCRGCLCGVWTLGMQGRDFSTCGKIRPPLGALAGGRNRFYF